MPPSGRKRATNGSSCSANIILGLKRNAGIHVWNHPISSRKSTGIRRTSRSTYPSKHRDDGLPWEILKESPRHAATVVARALETVHPSPGPRRGNVRTQKIKNQRRERKKAERVNRQPKSKQFRKIKITSCNLHGISVCQSNRARLRRIVEVIRKRGWEILLISEIRAE